MGITGCPQSNNAAGARIRSQRLVDGPDEVRKWITGKNVIRTYKKDGTTAAAAGGDLL